MRLHFWYVNLRNERGVLSFSRTVCVHVCSSLTLWEEFLHRVYSGATYAFRKAFCCDWMWYRNNPDGHRGGVNTFYSLCIFEGTSCIGGIVGVRLSVKCKQIPRTSDSCSGPTVSLQKTLSAADWDTVWRKCGFPLAGLARVACRTRGTFHSGR